MTTPDPFAPGYRLTDGNQLNYQVANPSWSVSGPVSATVGGTLQTSTRVTFTVTNLTTVGAPGAGLTIPQALPGRVLLIINSGANDVRVFADGGSTINGLDGAVGVLVGSGKSSLFVAVTTKQWKMLNFA